jgi:hypothetical protein
LSTNYFLTVWRRARNNDERRLPGLLILVLSLSCAGAVGATPPVLSAPARCGDQFQFTLAGESNGVYVIQGSTNLQSWTRLSTNVSANPVRAIQVEVSERYSFYRAFKPIALFTFALAARSSINLNGNNLTTDSFDSSDPNYSTFGRYDPLKNNDNGQVAAYSGLTNSLSVANANIMGHLYIGPGGTATIGPNGSGRKQSLGARRQQRDSARVAHQ